MGKLGNEPAFACVTDRYLQEGMSKRFYAACAAMQGVIAGTFASRENWLSIEKFCKEKEYSMNEYFAIVAYESAGKLLELENEHRESETTNTK